MLAKIECEGKTYPAIVLSSTFGMEGIAELKASLLSFMQSAFVEGSPTTFLSEDLYNITSLLREMEMAEDQSAKMIDGYFNGSKRNHQKFNAQITF